MEEYWQSFLTWLATEQTQFAGSWLAVGLSLFLALRIGLPQFEKVSKALKDAAEIREPDGRITRFDTKLRRIGGYWEGLMSALRSSLLALLPIVVLPLAVLVVLTVYAEWFFGTPSFLIEEASATGTAGHFGEMALFFIDQLSRGLMFDVMEVFEWRLSSIETNTSNTPYLSALVAFRMIVDIYVVGLIVLLGQAIYGITINSIRLINPMGLVFR